MKKIFQQPVIAWVSIAGTALAIFLMLIVIMLRQVQIADYPPESCRSHLIIGERAGTKGNDEAESWSNSFYHSRAFAEKLYAGLPHVTLTSYIISSPYVTRKAKVPGHDTDWKKFTTKASDANIWKMFDYEFMYGAPMTPTEYESGTHKVVISDNAARKLFSTDNAVGREILVNLNDTVMQFTVCGIIKKPSLLATLADGDLFFSDVALGQRDKINNGKIEVGFHMAYMLIDDIDNLPAVRAEVKRRLDQYNRSLAMGGNDYHAIDYGNPVTFEQYVTVEENYDGPRESTDRNNRQFFAIFVVLLIIPAINLSSMTQSRMSRRIAEIGVRRAFGCTRARIMLDVMLENGVITLIGAAIGITAAFACSMLFTGLFSDYRGIVGQDVEITLPMLVNWWTIAAILLFCFLLNLVSAALPAFRASRIEPVDAINSKRH